MRNYPVLEDNQEIYLSKKSEKISEPPPFGWVIMKCKWVIHHDIVRLDNYILIFWVWNVFGTKCVVKDNNHLTNNSDYNKEC